MAEKLLDAVAARLREVFGDGFKIYFEAGAQGMEAPCFLISPMEQNTKSLLGRRRLREVPFDVQYYPQGPEKNRELLEMGEALLNTLSVLRDGEGQCYRSDQFQSKITEGVLHMVVKYRFHEAPEEAPQETMDGLKVEVRE